MPEKKTSSSYRDRPDATERYYELKSRAMDDLVDAKPGRSKTYSMEELDRYRARRGIRVADWVKILFLKAWFAGAVCFFFLWGLGLYIGSTIDMLFVLGLALGFVTNLLTNPCIRFIERRPGANSDWMMFPGKGFGYLLADIAYAFLILACVYATYTGVNQAIAVITAQPDAVTLGVEPILFGLLCMGYDMLFVMLKRGLKRIVRDARDQVEGKR